MPTPIAPLSERLPSAARERAVEVLTRHFANDDLTEAELEARLQLVYAATSSRELDAIVRITGRAAFGFAEANIES